MFQVCHDLAFLQKLVLEANTISFKNRSASALISETHGRAFTISTKVMCRPCPVLMRCDAVTLLQQALSHLGNFSKTYIYIYYTRITDML